MVSHYQLTACNAASNHLQAWLQSTSFQLSRHNYLHAWFEGKTRVFQIVNKKGSGGKKVIPSLLSSQSELQDIFQSNELIWKKTLNKKPYQMHISNLEDTIVSQVCAYVTIRDVNADYNVLKRLNTKKNQGWNFKSPPYLHKT